MKGQVHGTPLHGHQAWGGAVAGRAGRGRGRGKHCAHRLRRVAWAACARRLHALLGRACVSCAAPGTGPLNNVATALIMCLIDIVVSLCMLAFLFVVGLAADGQAPTLQGPVHVHLGRQRGRLLHRRVLRVTGLLPSPLCACSFGCPALGETAFTRPVINRSAPTSWLPLGHKAALCSAWSEHTRVLLS